MSIEIHIPAWILERQKRAAFSDKQAEFLKRVTLTDPDPKGIARHTTPREELPPLVNKSATASIQQASAPPAAEDDCPPSPPAPRLMQEDLL